jgi:hypothetical protein
MHELNKQLVDFELTTPDSAYDTNNGSFGEKFKSPSHDRRKSSLTLAANDGDRNSATKYVANEEAGNANNNLSSPSGTLINHRKRKLENPVLSTILETCDGLENSNACVVEFESSSPKKDIRKKSSSSGGGGGVGGTTVKSEATLIRLIDFRIEVEPPSRHFDDYFEIVPDQSEKIELLAPDNSLFLAIARALLYKIYLIDRKYEFLLRRVYLHEVNDEFVFDSDLTLQELLRRNLCIFWLSHVIDGEFVPHCKYQK